MIFWDNLIVIFYFGLLTYLISISNLTFFWIKLTQIIKPVLEIKLRDLNVPFITYGTKPKLIKSS
jgi:hypothetical protein